MLLKLYSDDATNFSFCGGGEVAFFIKREDLRAQRFDKVRAQIEGDRAVTPTVSEAGWIAGQTLHLNGGMAMI